MRPLGNGLQRAYIERASRGGRSRPARESARVPAAGPDDARKSTHVPAEKPVLLANQCMSQPKGRPELGHTAFSERQRARSWDTRRFCPVTSSPKSAKHALELVCPDAPEERQLVLDSIDAALGRGRVCVEDNTLRLKPVSAGSRLWLAMTTGTDVRLAQCEECGRYFVAARHGTSPKTCSSSFSDYREHANQQLTPLHVNQAT